MRKSKAKKRNVMPDPMYGDKVVSKFINNIMYDGKKSTARAIMYDAFSIMGEKTGKNPLEVFQAAMANVAPNTEVRSRRIGGATYQVPVDVRAERKEALAIRWLKTYAAARRDKTMAAKLAAEFMAAANSEGSAFKKKEDTHRMAEANKAFAHFKW